MVCCVVVWCRIVGRECRTTRCGGRGRAQRHMLGQGGRGRGQVHVWGVGRSSHNRDRGMPTCRTPGREGVGAQRQVQGVSDRSRDGGSEAGVHEEAGVWAGSAPGAMQKAEESGRHRAQLCHASHGHNGWAVEGGAWAATAAPDIRRQPCDPAHRDVPGDRGPRGGLVAVADVVDPRGDQQIRNAHARDVLQLLDPERRPRQVSVGHTNCESWTCSAGADEHPRRKAGAMHVGTRRSQHKSADRNLARRGPTRPEVPPLPRVLPHPREHGPPPTPRGTVAK